MQRRFFCFLLILASCGTIKAQYDIAPRSISAGLFNHWGFDSGAKLGAVFKLIKPGFILHDNNLPNYSSYFISGHLAYYGKQEYYQSGLLTGEFGYRRQRTGKKTYSAFSLGIGYLSRWEAMTVTVNLQGESSVSEWEQRNFALPTANYEFGGRLLPKWDWYTKLSYGYAVSAKHPNTSKVFVEFGIQHILRRR